MSLDDDYDSNPDPITKEPGSHPIGTAVGATGGAAAGAAIGAMFGPLGMLVGGGIGAFAGGGAGHAVGEQLNPTHETEYWREAHGDRDYYDEQYDFERDYLPAYRVGWEARSRHPLDRDWDEDLESELSEEWQKGRSPSVFDWNNARHPIRDAWDRAGANYLTYANIDEYYGDRYKKADYFDSEYSFDDYRPAYRYGVYSRTRQPDADWDDRLESELSEEWEEFKGDSRLAWDKAKHATRDAWHSVERVLPGDFDNDGR